MEWLDEQTSRGVTVNPSVHTEVPAAEIQASEDFFAEHLGATVPA